MQTRNYNSYFFLSLLILVTVLAYFLMKPFLMPFLVAVILAHIFNPVYKKILRFTKREWLSSASTYFIIALIIIIPLIFIISTLIGEIHTLVINFNSNPDSAKRMIENINASISTWPLMRYFDFQKITNYDTIVSFIKSFSQHSLVILQNTFSGLAQFVFLFFVVSFSLFYLFIDGKKLIDRIMRMLPLSDEYEKILMEEIDSTMRATIKGTIFISIAQGGIGSLIFFVAGVASPIILGIMMAVFSVIPPIGSALVWVPVALVMLALGHAQAALGIFLMGTILIGIVDNFLRPRLVGKDTQLHPLVILFSTLGGIAIFGIFGFVIGPVIMAIFVALWNIYVLEFTKK